MNFFDLLKTEFKKVKRSKIVPLIFIAPLLVVISEVANLSRYFPGIYKCVVCNVYPECISLRLLSIAIFHDCCMCDDCRA